MSIDERLALARNAATNGRLFCLLMFAVWIAVYFRHGHSGALAMAVVASIPIGLASLADRLEGSAGNLLALASIVICVCHAFTTLLIAILG